MRLGSPLEAIAFATHHAAFEAFTPIQYETNDWEALSRLSNKEKDERRKNNDYPQVIKTRRLEVREVEVWAMFSQVWGSTALGFGGIGGAAMTPAYTIVVLNPSRSSFVVYFGARYAYTIDIQEASEEQRQNFLSDITKRFLCAVSSAPERYGAKSVK